MTREEAKDLIEIEYDSLDNYCDSNHCSVIDQIYDDFESRTCENCKYVENSGQTYSTAVQKCKLGIGDINEWGSVFCSKDFGCNKFERKDKK